MLTAPPSTYVGARGYGRGSATSAVKARSASQKSLPTPCQAWHADAVITWDVFLPHALADPAVPAVPTSQLPEPSQGPRPPAHVVHMQNGKLAAMSKTLQRGLHRVQWDRYGLRPGTLSIDVAGQGMLPLVQLHPPAAGSEGARVHSVVLHLWCGPAGGNSYRPEHLAVAGEPERHQDQTATEPPIHRPRKRRQPRPNPDSCMSRACSPTAAEGDGGDGLSDSTVQGDAQGCVMGGCKRVKPSSSLPGLPRLSARLEVRLVRCALEAALADLKQRSNGRFGVSRLDARLADCAPLLAGALAAIIRNSHSPALLPFTCSLLACDTASLQGSLHRSLLAAAESDLSSAAQAVAGRRGRLTATATAVPQAVATTGPTPHFNDCVGEGEGEDSEHDNEQGLDRVAAAEEEEEGAEELGPSGVYLQQSGRSSRGLGLGPGGQADQSASQPGFPSGAPGLDWERGGGQQQHGQQREQPQVDRLRAGQQTVQHTPPAWVSASPQQTLCAALTAGAKGASSLGPAGGSGMAGKGSQLSGQAAAPKAREGGLNGRLRASSSIQPVAVKVVGADDAEVDWLF
ncbi:hypothetical protein QJQ45_027589 [Haematococcus lacustris]|nr:hypothetical protein QJQ45_027589 [Haematococcus lacustris]